MCNIAKHFYSPFVNANGLFINRMNHLFLNKQRAILNFTPRGELGPQG
jgi:hypothetical protein